LIRNYFADLELSPGVGLEEVKRAYRRLARRFHPDLNPGDFYAKESFRRIQEAYEFLSSEDRLAKLNVALEKFQKSDPNAWSKKPSFAPTESFLDEWEVKDGNRNDELDIHLLVEIPNSSLGQVQKIEMQLETLCVDCKGRGGTSQSVKVTCKNCAGLAYQLIRRGAFRWKKTCQDCSGRGYAVIGACASCEGCGKIKGRATVDLAVPSKALESAVRYSNLGHFGFDGITRGDLWITWRIKI